jgi:hypothetical protein
MKFIKIAYTEQILINSFGFSKKLAGKIAEFFRQEENKRIKKHIAKQIRKDYSKNQSKKIIDNSFLIEEDPSFLIRIFPLVELTEVENLVKNSGVSEEAASYALDINREYAIWIAKQIDQGNIVPIEDNQTVIETLQRFDTLKNSQQFPNERKDINYYPSIGDLRAVIENYSGSESKAEKTRQLISGGVNTVYDKDGVKIIKLTNAQSVTYYAEGSSWCVRDITWARRYFSEHPGKPFYIVYVDGKRESLIHTGKSEIKGEENRPLENALVISRINQPLIDLGIIDELEEKNKYSDIETYKKAIKKIERINDDLKDDFLRRQFISRLKRAPDEFSYLNEDNRKDPIYFDSALEGYKSGIIEYLKGKRDYSEDEQLMMPYSDADEELRETLSIYIDGIPKIFADKINFLKINGLKELFQNQISNFHDKLQEKEKLNELLFQDLKSIEKIPKLLILSMDNELIKDIANNIENIIRENPDEFIRAYDYCPTFIRYYFTGEFIGFVKNYFLQILEGVRKTNGSVEEFFNDSRIPEYFFFQESFLAKCSQILLEILEKDPMQLVNVPKQFIDYIEENYDDYDFNENIIDGLDSKLRDLINTKEEIQPDDYLEAQYGISLDEFFAYFENIDKLEEFHELRYEYYCEYVRIHPPRQSEYYDITSKSFGEKEKYELYDAIKEGWSEKFWDDPFEAYDRSPSDIDQYLIDDINDLVDVLVNYFIRNPSSIDNKFHLIKDLIYEDEKIAEGIAAICLNLIGRIDESNEREMYKELLDNYANYFDIQESDSDHFTQMIDSGNINDLRNYFYSIIHNKNLDPNLEYHNISNMNKINEQNAYVNLKQIESKLLSKFEKEVRDEDLPEINSLIKSLIEYLDSNNLPFKDYWQLSEMFPKDRGMGGLSTREFLLKKIEDLVKKIDSKNFSNIQDDIKKIFSCFSGDKSRYSEEPLEHLEHFTEFHNLQFKPWYDFVIKNSKMLSDQNSYKGKSMRDFIIEKAPKEFLELPEIKSVIYGVPYQLEEAIEQRELQEQSTKSNDSSQETEEKEAKNWYKTYKIAKMNRK